MGSQRADTPLVINERGRNVATTAHAKRSALANRIRNRGKSDRPGYVDILKTLRRRRAPLYARPVARFTVHRRCRILFERVALGTMIARLILYLFMAACAGLIALAVFDVIKGVL